MKQMHMVAIAAGVVAIAVLQAQRAKKTQAVDPHPAGTDWFADMWARLHGTDLSLDGNNPIPSGLDVYGLTQTNAWHYGWDQATSQIAHGTM